MKKIASHPVMMPRPFTVSLLAKMKTSQRNLLETEASQQGADVSKLRRWLVGGAATPCDASIFPIS